MPGLHSILNLWVLHLRMHITAPPHGLYACTQPLDFALAYREKTSNGKGMLEVQGSRWLMKG